MLTLSSTRLGAAIGGLALSLATAAGIAAANPGADDPVITTTCSYPQALSALNAQNPSAAAQFNATPAAQSWLSSFLGAPRDQREQMIQQIQGNPEAAPYVAVMSQVANTCHNY